MSAKLLSLRNVPTEEADGIRDLLDEHHIEFYETPPSNWGISAPIIWIENEVKLERAKALLENFQEAFTARERAAYAKRVANNEQPTLLDTIIRHPLQVIFFITLAGAVAYISIVPFIELGQ